MRLVFFSAFLVLVASLLLVAMLVGVFPVHKAMAKSAGKHMSNSDGMVVIELFTSQSCSSCPPADKLLEQLSEMENVIALSCHVTYWDHLNWKDTLSQEFCTNRQRLYASHMKEGRTYTPQLVVNGAQGLVGSRRGQALSAISNAAKQNDVAHVVIRKSDKSDPDPEMGKQYIDVELPAIAAGGYAVSLFTYVNAHSEKMHSGENRGRSVNYVRAATAYDNMVPWSGNAETRNVSLPQHVDMDGVVVIVQSGDEGGPVVAAGSFPVWF